MQALMPSYRESKENQKNITKSKEQNTSPVNDPRD